MFFSSQKYQLSHLYNRALGINFLSRVKAFRNKSIVNPKRRHGIIGLLVNVEDIIFGIHSNTTVV